MPGEPTDNRNCPDYGKSKLLYENIIKQKAFDNIHTISYKFISKYVLYKNKWCKVYEQQFINNKWEIYHGNSYGSALTSIKYFWREFK